MRKKLKYEFTSSQIQEIQQAISLLRTSGFLEAWSRKGCAVGIKTDNPNFAESSIASLNFHLGYQEAVSKLIDFVEHYEKKTF